MADQQNDELVAGGQVAAAGVTAAAAEPSADKARPAARRAIRAKAEKVKLELSEEDCTRIADEVVNMIDARGGFDSPPEAVGAPAAAAPASGDSPAPAEAPRKQSWAERFRTG